MRVTQLLIEWARYRELIRFIGISSHNEEILRQAILSKEFDTVMIDYSAFNPGTAPLIELAAEHEIGVIVMRPLGGSGRTTTIRGNVDAGTAGVLTPENLLRYVLSNPGVSVAIPGARYPSRIVENAATASSYEPMSEAEKRELEAAARELY
jgi:predicted aldo/keto reductase-like oxidoreductase